jgi:hypothetical protein
MVTKKKLLITVGDSFTEGVGCYGDLVSNQNISFKELTIEYYQKSLDRFHEYGYPNELGRLLNYDKVINLGFGGSAPMSNVKYFFERYIDKDFSDYEVFVFWLIPSFFRASFYSNGRILSKIPSSKISGTIDKFDFHYMELISKGNIDLNVTLETIFGIKIMEFVCKSKNYDFLYTIVDVKQMSVFKEIYQSENYIQDFNVFEGIDYKSEFSPCLHPNELGYKKVAKNIYDKIKTEYAHLINKNKVENFEWIWDSHTVQHHLTEDGYQKIIKNSNGETII